VPCQKFWKISLMLAASNVGYLAQGMVSRHLSLSLSLSPAFDF
jgi:hypothetical protein